MSQTNTNKRRVPGLIAHRGYSCQYPENTLISMSQAFKNGACYVECDVQLTKDKVPVLMHDSDLLRTTAGEGQLHVLDYATLRTLSADYQEKFGSKYTNEKIPSLEEFVELLKRWPDRKAFVEIKRSSLREFGEEVVLKKILPILEIVREQVIIISFDDSVIRRLSVESGWKTGWVIDEWSTSAIDKAKELNLDYFFVDHECLPQELTTSQEAFFQELAWKWVIYEVDDPELASRLAQQGADLIETNDVGTLIQSDTFVAGTC